MLMTNETSGLCLTCNNRETCYYHATRGPALFCELFDDFVPAADRGLMRAPARAVAEPPAPVEEETECLGLCINCEHRRTCTHPRPSGGVWHCEDYE
jgi:hypothetical protein